MDAVGNGHSELVQKQQVDVSTDFVVLDLARSTAAEVDRMSHYLSLLVDPLSMYDIGHTAIGTQAFSRVLYTADQE